MAATVLTPVADTDPTLAAGNADSVGVVGVAVVDPTGANNALDFTGLVPGVAFEVVYADPGQDASPEVIAVTGADADGYVITVTLRSATNVLSTANQVLAAVNADPVASKIVVVSLHAANSGATAVTAMAEVASTGQVSPDVVHLGAEQAAIDTANGNTFANTGAEHVLIDNADLGTAQVTITSTDTLTVKTFEIDAAKFVNVFLPFAVWGAAPVITSPTTGIKLSVLAPPTDAEYQTQNALRLKADTAATTIADVVSLLQALRDDSGATTNEKRVYRRLIHQADVGQRRLTGTAPSTAPADRL